MFEPSDVEDPAQRRPVTLVLRLVLDRQGEIVYGQLLDTEDRAPHRFAGWQGLIDALRRWLALQVPGVG